MVSCGPWAVLAIGAVLLGVALTSVQTLSLGGHVTPKSNQRTNGTVDMDAVLNKVMMDFLQMLNRQKTTTTPSTTFAARGLPPEPPRAEFLQEAEHFVVEKVVTAPPSPTAFNKKTPVPTTSKILTNTGMNGRTETTLGISTPASRFGRLINRPKYAYTTYSPRINTKTDAPRQANNVTQFAESQAAFVTPSVKQNVPNVYSESTSTKVPSVSAENNISRSYGTIIGKQKEKTNLTETTLKTSTPAYNEKTKWTHHKIFAGEISPTTISPTTRSDYNNSTFKFKATEPVLKNNISSNRGGFTLPSLTIRPYTIKSSSVMAASEVHVAMTTTPSLVTKSRETIHTGNDDRTQNQRNHTTRIVCSPVCIVLTVICFLIGRHGY